MIGANELRLGNLVYANGKDVAKIMGIGPNTARLGTVGGDSAGAAVGDKIHYSYFQLTPIPLTPNVLLQAGFNKDLWDEFLHETLPISVVFEGNLAHIFAECFSSDGSQQLTTIEYVHQFQNFYFALSGEEIGVQQ